MKKILLIFTVILISGGLYAQTTKKASAMTPATTIGGTELIKIVQSGVTKTVTPNLLMDSKVSKADSANGSGASGKWVTGKDYNTDMADTVTFDTELITDAVLFTVGDTTVTPALGKVVFKTSDSHFYGCVSTTATSTPKWKPLDN